RASRAPAIAPSSAIVDVEQGYSAAWTVCQPRLTPGRLPPYQHPTSSGGRQPMSELGRGLDGLKVLVVEDETLVAMLLEDMLADHGCEVAATAGRIQQ